MMGKNIGIILILSVFIGSLALSGCSTVPKKFKEEVSGIKTRVDTLESRVEGVEGRQTDLERMSQEEAARGMARSNIAARKKTRSPESRAETKELQALLRDAGFYEGKIDGVKGRMTRKAIRRFQRAAELTVDGIAGPKTLEALSRYKAPRESSAREKEVLK